MKPATIVLVANTSWAIYNFRRDTISDIVKEGFEVVAIAPEDHYSDKLRSLPLTFMPSKHMKGRGKNPISDFLLFLELKKLYRQIRPLAIFHYTVKPNLYGTLAAHSLGIYNIAFTTGLGYAFMKRNPITWLIKKLYRVLIRRADQIWFLNTDDQADFRKLGILDNIPNRIVDGEGVDTSFFSPQVIDYNQSETVFVLPSRIMAEKGVKDFVKAAKIVRSNGHRIRALLAGPLLPDDPSAISLKDVETWARQGDIEYVGEKSDIRYLIAQSHCVVLPTYYREGIPRVLLEAGSMERAAITTDNTGCRDVIEHGYNGLICAPQDPEDLARKMEEFIDLSVDEKLQMAKNAREKILSHYDQKIISQLYLDVIQSLSPTK